MLFAQLKHNAHAETPAIFRSYEANEPETNFAIWEALCATTAYPDLFERTEIAEHSIHQTFFGGMILDRSNPIVQVLAEVKRIYPDRQSRAS